MCLECVKTYLTWSVKCSTKNRVYVKFYSFHFIYEVFLCLYINLIVSLTFSLANSLLSGPCKLPVCLGMLFLHQRGSFGDGRIQGLRTGSRFKGQHNSEAAGVDVEGSEAKLQAPTGT